MQVVLVENCTLQELMRTLEDLVALTKVFQDGPVHLCDICEYLEAAIRTFPELEMHCLDVSKIVEDVEFEKALEEIRRSKLLKEAINLSPKEICSVEHLSKSVRPLRANSIENKDAHQKLLQFCASFDRIKRQKPIPGLSETDKYLNTCFICPTSNMRERLFSVSGYTPEKCRQIILPVNMEI